MGWSCRVEAGRTLDAWEAFCVKQTGSSNLYRFDGVEYFFECNHTEHADGSITGASFRMDADGVHAWPLANWKIEGNGTVKRWPTALRKAMKLLVDS